VNALGAERDGVWLGWKDECTSIRFAAVLVDGGIGAVEIHVLVSHEATVLVLCMDVLCCDGIPGIAHAAM
jgi:hypothetical protein